MAIDWAGMYVPPGTLTCASEQCNPFVPSSERERWLKHKTLKRVYVNFGNYGMRMCFPPSTRRYSGDVSNDDERIF